MIDIKKEFEKRLTDLQRKFPTMPLETAKIEVLTEMYREMRTKEAKRQIRKLMSES